VKKLSGEDLRASLSRKNLLSEADSAHILHFSERCLAEKIGQDFFFRARTFRQGILFFSVENSAAADKVQNVFFEIFPHIKAEFPNFNIRGMRVKIETQKTS